MDNDAPAMPTLALVTTCKGRLEHLRQTLPAMLRVGADETIVVDYDCPDGTARWLAEQHPEVRCIVRRDAPGFNTSIARNLGWRASSADWVLFVDADVAPATGLRDWRRSRREERAFYCVGRQGAGDLCGTALVERSALERIGGYDERFGGWGCEDLDLYERLRRAGYREKPLPRELLAAIPHDDELRTRFLGPGSRGSQYAVNQAYLTLKGMLESITGDSLRGDALDRLRAFAEAACRAAEAGDAAPPYGLRIGRNLAESTLRLVLEVSARIERRA